MEVAPELIGKYLCRQVDGEVRRYRITETECYYGEADTACHARAGRTARTAVMYEAGGAAYVYLCYGLHYLLNVVTGPAGHPEAVLIRGVEGAAGPARATKLLGVDKNLNGEDLVGSARLWLEDGAATPWVARPRVGINYASLEDRERLWRWVAV
jgi:DNA-3-methyladenine glycosylase